MRKAASVRRAAVLAAGVLAAMRRGSVPLWTNTVTAGNPLESWLASRDDTGVNPVNPMGRFASTYVTPSAARTAVTCAADPRAATTPIRSNPVIRLIPDGRTARSAAARSVPPRRTSRPAGRPPVRR